MKALHKDVIFARRVVMLRKIVGSWESYNAFIAKSLVTCKKNVNYWRTINKQISQRRKKVNTAYSMHANMFSRRRMIHGS
jgi:hypothetical protein